MKIEHFLQNWANKEIQNFSNEGKLPNFFPIITENPKVFPKSSPISQQFSNSVTGDLF